MPNGKLKILLDAIAQVVEENIPKGKSASKAGMEYGISPAEISAIRKGSKNIEISTYYKLSEMIEKDFNEFSNLVYEKLPANFSLEDI